MKKKSSIPLQVYIIRSWGIFYFEAKKSWP